jgi:hypothetical protein
MQGGRRNICAGVEVLEAGLATHFVASERLPALEEALHNLGPKARDPAEVGRTLQSFQVPRWPFACMRCIARLAGCGPLRPTVTALQIQRACMPTDHWGMHAHIS